MSQYRHVPVTDMSQLQTCPSTDRSQYRHVPVQTCPSTDQSQYRPVPVQTGPSAITRPVSVLQPAARPRECGARVHPPGGHGAPSRGHLRQDQAPPAPVQDPDQAAAEPQRERCCSLRVSPRADGRPHDAGRVVQGWAAATSRYVVEVYCI